MAVAEQIESSAKCGGHCCRRFGLEFSFSDLISKYVRALGEDIREGNVELSAFTKEVEKIQDMVIPLGEFDYDPSRPDIKLVNPCYHYTCRHLKGDLCSNYENRPDMCRNYPYGHICGFKISNQGCRAYEI